MYDVVIARRTDCDGGLQEKKKNISYEDEYLSTGLKLTYIDPRNNGSVGI